MATSVRKDFPVFDGDSHIVRAARDMVRYVPARIRAWVKTHSASTPDSDLLSSTGAWSRPRASAPMPPRSAGALRQKEWASSRPDRGMAKEFRAPARLAATRSAAQGHGRAGHRPGDAVPHVFVRLALVRSAERRRCWLRLHNWVLDYCAGDRRRLFPCAVPALAERRGVDRGAPAGRQAGLQGGGVRPCFWNGAIPPWPSSTPVARVRGHRGGAGHAHLPFARGADARMGRAHGPGARPLGPGPAVHRRVRGLFARPVRVEHHRGHGSGHRRFRDARLPAGGDDLGDGGGADRVAGEVPEAQGGGAGIHMPSWLPAGPGALLELLLEPVRLSARQPAHP